MDFLTEIVAHKQNEIAARKRARPRDELQQLVPRPARDFAGALRRPGISAIAEIKRRSPSKGSLRQDLNVALVARGYADCGAVALSVLTDEQYFGGSDSDLQLARESAALPVLRKDFTIDEYQIHEARAIGADAILLIVRILTDTQLREYVRLARELDLAALVEVHDENELTRSLACEVNVIGVNSRNLDTFEVSLETALRLKARIPVDCVAVAESGIHTRNDVSRLEDAGYDAILVGEALMRAPDPSRKLAELLGVAS
jgi:indole-3-glycerol phosphate synthase